jgi:peptidoglycan/xylan/chitin deacetylase (PgdA/CDA1 family)
MDRPARIGRLPLLTFHALDDDARSAIAFPPLSFVRAIETLAGLGARTVGLDEVAARLRSGGSFPRRSFALTFDDGYRSVYDIAFSALLRSGFTATVFLAVGRGRTGPNDTLPSLSGRPMLSWGEIRAMHRSGITFGAHTLTHADLTRLPLPGIREQVQESKARIEDALGAPVGCFAYPYGAADRQSRRIVAESFGYACSDRLGVVTARSDPYALERVDAYYLRAVWLFKMIFSEMFPWYLRARNLPRIARRRLGEAAGRRPLTAGTGEGGRSRREVVHER